MNSTRLEWLERADRLRDLMYRHWLANLDQPGTSARSEEEEANEEIARWLRQEFSEEPPQDTETQPLPLDLPALK
jgi:hypothetical protein